MYTRFFRYSFLLLIITALSACVRVTTTVYDENGNIKSQEKSCKLFQMQVVKDSATIESEKLYGSKSRIPILLGETFGYLELIIGYMSVTRGIIPRKANGELPNVIIDITTDERSMSDTYAVGNIAEKIYPEIITEQLREDTCSEPESEPEPDSTRNSH